MNKVLFLSKCPVISECIITCPFLWLTSWHPCEHIKHYVLTNSCCLSDFFSLSLFQQSKKRGLSKCLPVSYQHLPAGQIYSFSVQKKKKKRWGSAVMLKRLHPHVELLYTMFMYDCTFCANWYRMITSVSSEKAADMCVQSICLLMMQCNYVTRKTILYVTHIKLF